MEQYNFCMRLLRNLNIYPDDIYSLYFKPERCNNLNYWIYNSKKKHDIKDDLILKCFGEYFDRTTRVPGMVDCKYHSYDESYDDPMVAIMLNIFDSNISDIQKTLSSKAIPTYTSGQKFVCECFKIYKERYNVRCLDKYSYDEKQEKTCDKLDTFRRTYELYLLRDESLVEKIPSFKNMESEYKTKCHLNEPTKLVVPGGVADTNDVTETPYVGERGRDSAPLTAGAGENEDGKLSLGANGEETTGRPISSTISTAVGTMAGASSVLALLYKVNNNFI
ncbi:hypothetical protein PVBG_05190 [Plasmodium vivax Brazil I]|uniref:Uncharacterized protein n=1 Tax=Plasmodium vivax (strain Brazil I) TaxID=1033975 RepID=A0A0J9SJM2_PLAV1|nr:hypothetical protein PVBG_05190 [Plasmodium vivax Brazil I]